MTAGHRRRPRRGFLACAALALACLGIPSARAAAPFVDPRDHGARCDGTGDDAAAFQAALDIAARDGATLRFSGTCRVGRPLTLQAAQPRSFRVDGGGGTILTGGNDLFVIAPEAGVSAPFTPGFANFSVRNTAAQGGRAIVLDGSRNAHGALASPRVHDIDSSGMLQTLVLVDVGDARVSDMAVAQTGNPEATAILIRGTSPTRFAANNTFRAITVIGGYGWHLVGAIQGVNIADSKVMLGTYGVKTDAEILAEGAQITGSYFEAARGGLVFHNWSLLQLIGNAFDAHPSGLAPDWGAIVVDGDKPPFGINVEHSNLSAFGGPRGARQPPFRITATQADISGNVAVGLNGTDGACMRIDAPTPNAGVLVHDNVCWASGGFAYGGHVVAHDNLWSGAANDRQALSAAAPAAGAPRHSHDPCTPGQTAWDASYEYRCVAADTWQRAARAPGKW